MPQLSNDVLVILFIAASVLILIGAVVMGRRQQAAVGRAYQEVSERTGLIFTRGSSKGPATLRGTFKGRESLVYSFGRRSGRATVIYTAVEVAANNPANATLNLSPGTLGGAMGIGQGGGEFETRFKVSSNPPELADRALNPDLRARLMEISGSYTINLAGGTLKFERMGRIMEAAGVEKVLTAVTELADRIEGK